MHYQLPLKFNKLEANLRVGFLDIKYCILSKNVVILV